MWIVFLPNAWRIEVIAYTFEVLPIAFQQDTEVVLIYTFQSWCTLWDMPEHLWSLFTMHQEHLRILALTRLWQPKMFPYIAQSLPEVGMCGGQKSPLVQTHKIYYIYSHNRRSRYKEYIINFLDKKPKMYFLVDSKTNSTYNYFQKCC